MIARNLSGIAAVTCVLLLPSAAAAAAKADDRFPLRLVLLDAAGPRVLDLVIEVDGRPIVAASSPDAADRTSRLAKWLDADQDGAVSVAEADRLPPPLLLLPAVRVGETADVVGFALAAGVCDADRDGRVSVAELSSYHRLLEGPPWSVQADVTPAESSDRLSRAVFTRLDGDGDGQLSAAEIDAAPQWLAALDQDDNQVVAADELGAAAEERDIVAVEGVAMQPPVRAGLAAFRRGEETAAAARIIRQVNAERNRAARGGIRLAEAGWTGERAARLDADGDGRIDATELRALLLGEAAGSLRVRLGAAGDKPALEFSVGADGEEAKASLSGGVLGIPTADGRLVVHKLDSGVLTSPETFEQRVRAAFTAADAESDGHLAGEEIAASPFARAARFIDRNGDGGLAAEEVAGFVRDVALPRRAAAAERVTLILGPRRAGLFQLLDVNQDGRLGMREMRAAAEVLLAADADEDGRLKPEESPAVFRLAIARGESAMFGRGEDQLPPQVESNEPFSYASPGPPWFRKMDRNRDGDVTPREFLGSLDRFEQLDSDRDGLLSGEEALRWRE